MRFLLIGLIALTLVSCGKEKPYYKGEPVEIVDEWCSPNSPDSCYYFIKKPHHDDPVEVHEDEIDWR